VCSALTQEVSAARIITCEKYDAQGRTEGILRDYLKQQLAQLPAEEREPAWRLLRALVTSDLRRAVRAYSELTEELKTQGVSRESLDTILVRLVERRLLLVQEKTTDDERTYELAHDYLVREIELDPQEQARKAAQELLEQEVRVCLRYRKLIAEDRFGVIESYHSELRFTREAEALYSQSKAAIQREHLARRKRLISFIAGMSVVAIVTTLSGLYGLNKSQEANHQAATAQAASTRAVAQQVTAVTEGQRADRERDTAINAQATAEVERDRSETQARIMLSRQLAAQARNAGDSQYDLALLLSLQANNIANTIEARASLLEMLEYNPRLTTFLQQSDYPMQQVAYSPDGQMFASTTCAQKNTDGSCVTSEIRLWDLETDQLIGHVVTVTGFLGFLQFAPDGRKLVMIRDAHDGKSRIIFWDFNTAEFVDPDLKHDATCFAFSSDGRILASGGFDNRIILWDTASNQMIGKPFVGHNSYVLSLAFSPDGTQIVSGDLDGNVLLWNVKTAQLVGPPLLGHKTGVWYVGFDPAGKTIFSGGSATKDILSSFIAWDVATSRVVAHQELAGEAVAFSHDGETMAAGSSSNIKLWKLPSQQPAGEPLKGHSLFPFRLAFSRDDHNLASVGGDGNIILWDLTAQTRLGHSLDKHTKWVRGIAISPDGHTLASASFDHTIILWNTTNGLPIGRPLEGHTSQVRSVAFSPDGRMLASGGDDNAVILWRIGAGEPISQSLYKHASSVYSVAFSPNGQLLASASDETVILWQLDTNSQAGEPLSIEKGLNTSIAFSPDGKELAIADAVPNVVGSSPNIILWNISSRQRRVFKSQNLPVALDIAFSPDSTLIASGGFDGVITLWNVAAGQPVGQIRARDNGVVSSIAFSPDSRVLVAGACAVLQGVDCMQGDISLWDVSTLKSLGRFPTSHEGYVSSLAFTPDGKTLASSGSDSRIILWDVSLESWQARACRIANRNLTIDEWNQYIGTNVAYQRTCSNLPPGKGAPLDASAASQIVSEPGITSTPKIPAIGRVQSVATVTPISTPKPTITSTQQSVVSGKWRTETAKLPEGLSLVFPAIIKCRESADSDKLAPYYMGMWAIKGDQPDKWFSDGKGEIVLQTETGVELKRYDVEFGLVGNEVGWLMSNENKAGNVMQLDNDLDTTVLKLSVKDFHWTPISQSVGLYHYNVGLQSHITYGNPTYPQHALVLQVQNASGLIMKQVHFMGVVQNSRGDTLDILSQSTGMDLAPGEAGFSILKSHSKSGRCVGPADPDGYVLHYWLDFGTEDGQRVTRYYTTMVE
jgi:WD40 repeat protein